MLISSGSWPRNRSMIDASRYVASRQHNLPFFQFQLSSFKIPKKNMFEQFLLKLPELLFFTAHLCDCFQDICVDIRNLKILTKFSGWGVMSSRTNSGKLRMDREPTSTKFTGSLSSSTNLQIQKHIERLTEKDTTLIDHPNFFSTRSESSSWEKAWNRQRYEEGKSRH